ncbi:hypothetical protein [Xenophilus azovorans]|uniref:hypothetical protein n=1 Tax=Xenophilus azovorans TaxID=151755 RepID=UPI00056F3526|nr:hypothetical protein [Xenophilus azovorans]
MTGGRIKIGNTEAALRRVQAADLASRQSATTILSPEAVSGKVSPARVLMTTIDGAPRVITADDLRRFRARIAEVGKNLRVGITPREALSMSRPIDLKRARDEIKFAVPVFMRGDVLRLATDSGPASKVSRHIFEVQLPQFTAAVARPATAQQAAAWLLSETPIRFNCDCEAHTFWLRYLASVGGWAYGRQETGFPKIRNPRLAGCLCKHGVRAVDTLSSLLIRRHVAKAIEQARAALERPGVRKTVTVRATQQEADRATARKTARRIVVPPQQRAAKLPPPATSRQIETAMTKLRGRPDSAVLLAALEHMLAAVPGARH